jgi:hypothetical protein
MNEVRVMTPLSRKLFCLFAILFSLSATTLTVHAGGQTVFGPNDFEIKRWRIHISLKKFRLDEPGEGRIIITNNNANGKSAWGFVHLNGKHIRLRQFLRSSDHILESKVKLRHRNHLIVFLWGRGASISVEVKKKIAAPPKAPPNSQPQITSTTVTTATVGVPYKYDVDATDPDTDDTLTFSLDTVPYGMSIDSATGVIDWTPGSGQEGDNPVIVRVTDVGLLFDTQSFTITVSPPPPEITFSADPSSIPLGEDSTLSWLVENVENGGTCSIDQGVGNVGPTGFEVIRPTETTTYTLTAQGAGGSTTESVTVTVHQPPTVNLTAEPETISYGASSTLSWTSTNSETIVIDPAIGTEPLPLESSQEVRPSQTSTYTINSTGPGGTANAQATITVKARVEPQPEGSFGEQYQDLIPTDATLESYDPKRFSLITGLVQDLGGSPIADVSVTIHGHLEYGTAVTDSQGQFSIPVEGGGTVTVVFQKQGRITIHRKVHVPWNDIAMAETIKMISEDPVSTTLTFDGNPDTVVTHESTQVNDEFGSRSATIVFTGDNRAYAVDAQGNVIQDLNTITTRATEFTTPESMPAKLPPNSGYAGEASSQLGLHLLCGTGCGWA